MQLVFTFASEYTHVVSCRRSCAEEVTRAKGVCAEKMAGGGDATMTMASGAVMDYQELYTRLDIVKVRFMT